MAWNNCSISLNDVDISNVVISYEREKSICAGTSSLSLVVEWKTPITFTAWDEIKLYEQGNKVGTFLVSSTEKVYDGNFRVNCQDFSKKLTDWFVAETQVIPDFAYTKTWIEYYLNLVGVSYDMNVDSNGVLINNNTVFGRQMAFDIIQSLMQMSGWYMYFDPDGTCIIQSLTNDLTSPHYTLQDHQIDKLQINTSDKSLRNRAVVWGLVSPDENKRVTADITVSTPWDTSDQDKRAVVLSNSYVRSSSVAKSLARKMLNTFAELSVEKTISLVYNYNFEVGQVVQVESEYFTGTGLITTVQSKMSATDGLVSTIILDQKCPRLFGYFGYIVPVYIGTDGKGVWRKPLDSGLWENFSNGLFENPIDPSIPGIDVSLVNPTEGIVPDLIIKNGVFGCVNGTWGYCNIGHGAANWKKLDPLTVTDLDGISYTQSSLQAVACDLDPVNNNILIGYKLLDSAKVIIGEQRSWIVEYTPKRRKVSEYFLSFGEDKQDFELVDIDAYTSSRNMSTAIVPASYDHFWGDRKISGSPGFENIPDRSSTSFGIVPSDVVQSGIASFSIIGQDDPYGTHDLLIEGNTVVDFGDRNTFVYIAHSGDTKFNFGTYTRFDYTFSEFDPLADGKHLFRYIWRENPEDSYTVLDAFIDYAESVPATNKYVLSVAHSEYSPLVYEYPTKYNDCDFATTTDIVLSGIQMIDGYSSGNNRILVKDQFSSSENGIYLANTTAVWTRYYDLDSTEDARQGMLVHVNYGDTNNCTTWQTDGESIPIIGRDPIIFYEVLKYTPITKQSIKYAENIYDENGVKLYIDSSTLSAKTGIGGNIFFTKNIQLNVTDSYPPIMYENGVTVIIYNREEKRFIARTLSSRDEDSPNRYKGFLLPENSATYVLDESIVVPYLYYDTAGLYPDDPTVYVDLSKCRVNIGTYIVDPTGVPVRLEEQLWNWWLPYKWTWRDFPPDAAGIWRFGIFSFNTSVDGYSTGTIVKPIIKFRFRILEQIIRFECSGQQPGCDYGAYFTITGVEEVFYGTIRFNNAGLMDVDYLNGKDGKVQYPGVQIGFCSCATFLYSQDDWNAVYYSFSTQPYALHSRLNNPRYIKDNDIHLPGSFNNTGIDLPIEVSDSIVVSCMMDDLDNSIYLFNLSKSMLYKVSTTGRLLARFKVDEQSIAFTGYFIFVSGLLIFGAVTSNGITAWEIYKINDASILPGQKICLYLDKKDKEDQTKVLDYSLFPMYLENSRNAPPVGWTVGSGLISYNTYDENDSLVNVGDIYPQNFKIYNDFRSPNIVYSGVFDTRVVDLGGNFPVISGEIIDLDYQRYAVLAGDNDTSKLINATPFTSDDIIDVFTPVSGIINYRIETSNYYGSQYMFTTTSGDNPSFFQKNPGAVSWIDYSALLPGSNIICVRLDDLV